MRALQTWEHYLVSKEFVIHSDYESFEIFEGSTQVELKTCNVDEIS